MALSENDEIRPSNLEEGLLANDSLQEPPNAKEQTTEQKDELGEAGILENRITKQEISTKQTSTQPEKTLAAVKWQVVALIISVQCYSFIMMSILPYSAFMCIHLVPGLTTQNVGPYAGLMNTMTLLGQIVSSYPLGIMADKYGRRAVFLVSYFFTIVFSIAFGMSTNIYMAFSLRVLLGASNNLFGLIKTVLSELADGDKKFEVKLMGLVISSRGWLGLYGPYISGHLAEPLKLYPDSFLSTTFHGYLAQYPFVLPNLVAALFCAIGMVFVYYFIPETRQKDKHGNSPKVTMRSIWNKPAARDHMITFWIFSFVIILGIESTPLFYVAKKGGLALEENVIGNILSIIGLIYVIFQYAVLQQTVKRFGVYGTLRIASIINIPFIVFIPISVLLNQGQAPNTLSLAAATYLISLQSIRRLGGSLAFTCISLAGNRSVERNELSVFNALSMTVGSGVQSLSPLLSGVLTSFALTSDMFASPIVGIFSLYGFVSAFGVCVSIWVFVGLHKHHKD